MKTKISEREKQILSCAFHILLDLDTKLWKEYLEDKYVDGQCKFYGKTHKARKLTYSIVCKMQSLFGLMKIFD